jgi:hypothetical protein
MADIQEVLLDENQAAAALYTYWISLLRTDKVDGADDVGEWDTIPDDYRIDFIEAVRVTIVDPLRKYVEEVEFEKNLDQAFQNTNVPGPPCYVCGTNTVPSAGQICGPCSYSHLQR